MTKRKIANINRKTFFIFIPFFVICIQQMEAKNIMMVPLTAPWVYKLLRQTDNLDAVPEGRVITQGIAAATGFTLGLTKAVGAALLYDIITANITEDTAQTSSPTPAYTTQEICFNSRNARSLDEAEAIAEAYSRLEEKDRELPASVRKSQEKRRLKPKRNKRRKYNNKRKSKRPQRIKVFKPNTSTATPTLTTNPTTTAILTSEPATTTNTGSDTNTSGSQATQPTSSNAATNTGTGGVTNIDNGTGSETLTSTTTSSDNNNSLTCIVIEKPKQ